MSGIYDVKLLDQSHHNKNDFLYRIDDRQGRFFLYLPHTNLWKYVNEFTLKEKFNLNGTYVDLPPCLFSKLKWGQSLFM